VGKYIQGVFKPKNYKKYKGDPTNIIYRSSWELKFLMECDRNPSILEYSSEEIIVLYISPKDNKAHRYFPDFVIKIVNKEGKVETVMVEIKPLVQTQMPKRRERVTKGYINEILTYEINQSKWTAAEAFCKKKGWRFQVMTEKDLGIR